MQRIECLDKNPESSHEKNAHKPSIECNCIFQHIVSWPTRFQYEFSNINMSAQQIAKLRAIIRLQVATLKKVG